MEELAAFVVAGVVPFVLAQLGYIMYYHRK